MPGMVDPSVIYQIVLLLHIAAAIVGFGGVIAHSAYNAKAFGGTAGDAAVLLLRTTQLVTALAHYAIYGVFAARHRLGCGQRRRDQLRGAMDLGIVRRLVPAGRRGPRAGQARGSVPHREGRGNGPDRKMTDDPAVVGLAKRLALGEGLTQLLLVIALVLMIWQP